MWIIAIPIVVIALFMLYSFVIVPKMNASYEAKMNNASNDFAQQIAGNESEIKKQFIQENEHIKPIALQINDQAIIAVISCQEKRETKDFLRQQAVNMAGKALGKLTGIGVKEVDNTEFYYLALTDTNLHYLHYSERGQCKEHLSFQRANMTNLEVGKVTSADILKNNAYVGETERFSFESGDTQYKFFFYDKVYAHPSAKKHGLDDLAKVNYLFAKPFLTFLSPYRSN